MRMLLLLSIMLISTFVTATAQDIAMFTKEEFAKIRFLEGRWVGKAPDGTEFYEEYAFPSDVEMQSRRATDSTFAKFSDGSVVALDDGLVTSTWGEFNWRASSITADAVHFEPINAPSSFSWRRLSVDEIAVVQEWTDENGEAQSYTVSLNRVK